MQRTFVRLLRASDLPYIKDVHTELFSFPLQVSDDVLNEAVASAGRWTCLAAVQLQPGGEERMAGFILSAIGSAAEFEKGDYHLPEDNENQAAQATAGSSESSQKDMGLHLLGLKPEDVVANVCLLGVMQDYRRAGVATQLFTQVINSARIARAARIFLHVLEGNQAALSFYKKQGFTIAGTVPRYYSLPGPTPGETVTRDALLLSLDMSALAASTQQQTGSSAEGRLLASSAAYRAARKAAVAGTVAGTNAGGQAGAGVEQAAGSAPRAAPAPKMRGLMGPSSSSSRRPARPAAAVPPPPTSSSSSSSSGSQASSLGGPKDILGALGSWLRPGGQQQQQQQQQPKAPQPGESVVVGDEQLLLVKGADQELHVVEPGDSSSTSSATGGSQQSSSSIDTAGADNRSYNASVAGGDSVHSQAVGARDVRVMCSSGACQPSREGLHRLPAQRATSRRPAPFVRPSALIRSSVRSIAPHRLRSSALTSFRV